MKTCRREQQGLPMEAVWQSQLVVAPLDLLGCAFHSLCVADNLGKFLGLVECGFVWLVVFCW